MNAEKGTPRAAKKNIGGYAAMPAIPIKMFRRKAKCARKERIWNPVIPWSASGAAIIEGLVLIASRLR